MVNLRYGGTTIKVVPVGGQNVTLVPGNTVDIPDQHVADVMPPTLWEPMFVTAAPAAQYNSTMEPGMASAGMKAFVGGQYQYPANSPQYDLQKQMQMLASGNFPALLEELERLGNLLSGYFPA